MSSLELRIARVVTLTVGVPSAADKMQSSPSVHLNRSQISLPLGVWVALSMPGALGGLNLLILALRHERKLLLAPLGGLFPMPWSRSRRRCLPLESPNTLCDREQPPGGKSGHTQWPRTQGVMQKAVWYLISSRAITESDAILQIAYLFLASSQELISVTCRFFSFALIFYSDEVLHEPLYFCRFGGSE